MSHSAGGSPFDIFIDREMRQKQVHANSAKLAMHSAETPTTGWGEVDIDECIVFDSLFVERPSISYGYAADQGDLVDGWYPRCTGFVRDWKLDTSGFYRGAWVSVVVDGYSEGGPFFGYEITHSWLFTGISIKPIREDLTAASDPVPNEQLEVIDPS